MKPGPQEKRELVARESDQAVEEKQQSPEEFYDEYVETFVGHPAPWANTDPKFSGGHLLAGATTIPPFEPTLKRYRRTPPPIAPRAELLREAEGLITGDRNQSYGTPTQNFQNIADLWNVQFGHMLAEGHKFTAPHIAQAMAHVKLARMAAQPKRDNYLDLAGYAACGWEAESNG